MKRMGVLGLMLLAWVGMGDVIWPGAGVSVTPSKYAQVKETPEGVVLDVRTCAPNVWPAVYFNFATPRDLTKCASLLVTLTNRSDKALRLSVKVKGITQQGQLPEGGITVPAHGSRVKELRLFAESWAFDKPHGLVGLKRQPSVGSASSYSLAKVTAISVYLPNGTSGVSFGVKDVSMTPGDAVGNKLTLLKVDSFFPWVDEFGQANYAEFPDKIHSKEELVARHKIEERELAAHPCGIPESDAFGGWAGGPKLKATGYFRTQKLNGKWWLVDPEGHLFISHGLNCGWELSPTGITGREKYFEKLPPKEGPTKQFWSYRKKPSSKNWYSNPSNAPFWAFSPSCHNLWLKFGDDWRSKNDENMARRMRAWGINTTTGTREGVRKAKAHVPYITAIGPWARPIAGTKGYWGQLCDFFAPEFEASCRRAVEAAREIGTNKWCVGWTSNNEQTWYGDGVSLARAVFASPDDQPAKVALTKILAERGKTYATATEADLRALAVALAEKYYSTVRAAIKAVAPNHLYLGDRNDKLNPEVFLAASRHADVITINRYEFRPEAELPPGSEDKPFLVTEFHFGCYDTGYFYASLIPVKDQKTRAQCYLDYQRAVVDSPNYVGAHWFCWRDLPITGEAGIGANAQCGLVSITDIPYTELVEAVKTVSGEMYARRYGKPIAKSVLVPAPRKMTTGVGAYEVKAKEITPELAVFAKDAAIPAEGYALSVTPSGISVKSSDDAGAFYALQTLRQLGQQVDKNLIADLVNCAPLE